MAVLNSWQKIDRVLPGQPFGSGVDGAYTSGTIPTLVVKTCSGTADSTTLTADTDATPFSVNDVVLIHQSRGTGVGQWEINRVSAVGSDEYTMQVALKYTYTDSGASQAQVIKIPMYSSVNVASGTWTITDWAGDTGGILPIACNSTFSHGGTITGSEKGFVGGVAVTGTFQAGKQGEGTVGAGGTASADANGTGGGGGPAGDGSYEGSGGGGGGHSSSGGGHSSDPFAGYAVTGGTTGGSADGTTIVFGGAGGSGGTRNNSATSGTGGDSGAIIMLFVKTLTSLNSVTNNGGNGTDSNENQTGGGGGGAGGHFLLCCESGTLGSSAIVCSGGALGDAPDGSNDGGAGSAGRVTVHHSGTVTGTTNPTFEDVSDPSMIENVGGYFHMTA